MLLASGSILLLRLAPAICGIGLVTTVDYMEPGDILPPGTHLLGIKITNTGASMLGEGSLSVSLGRLHEGEEKNLTLDTGPIVAGSSLETSIPVDLPVPGLYTARIIYRSGFEKSETALDLEVSGTTDRWQIWREPREIPNKTHLLLAFYYPWYGTPDVPQGSWLHWVPWREYDSIHVPLIGFYDSQSTEVVDYHVRVAQSAGLDGFISSWWGPGNYIDDGFGKLLDVAGDRGFNATIYLENAGDGDDLLNQLRYVLTRYSGHPAFLRSSGRPVIFIYSRVIGALELEEFARVFSVLRSEGLDAFYLADRLDQDYLDVFDGIHTYSPLSGMDRYPELVAEARDKGRLFAATIAPGYDDTVIREPGLVVGRANGTYYRDSWETVMLSGPDWVLITSWNEWHEGSEIEPSLEHGDLYLNLTRLYYGLFESGRLTPRWEERMGEMEDLFSMARGVIDRMAGEGLDTRIVERDYSIAMGVWDNYDYDVAKMYLQRILEKDVVVPELEMLPLLGTALLIFSSRGPWCRG